MSAKHLICAVNKQPQDHRPPQLVLVLPDLVWLRRIRRVLFQNDFFFKFIYLNLFFKVFFTNIFSVF